MKGYVDSKNDDLDERIKQLESRAKCNFRGQLDQTEKKCKCTDQDFHGIIQCLQIFCYLPKDHL